MESVCGVNMLTERIHKPFDLYCPAIPNANHTPNAYLSHCLIRQQDPKQRMCYKGCKAVKVLKRGAHWCSDEVMYSNRRSKEKAINGYIEILKLLEGKGMSVSQAAEETGVSLATVNRAKKWAKEWRDQGKTK